VRVCLGIAVLTMGFSGLVAQMLLLRELFIVFSGNEFSIGIILANWLILEALGCFVLGRRAETARNKVVSFAAITILFSLSLPAAVYIIRILKSILGVSIGESLCLLPMFYSSLLILLPVSLSHGALFTFSCKLYSTYLDHSPASIGKVYVFETIGTILGGVVWTYLLIIYLHAFQMAVGLALFNFIVLLILLIHHRVNDLPQKIATIISILLIVFSIHLFSSGGVDKLHRTSIKVQWKDHNVVHYQNSIYGNICVVKSGEQYIFFYNGIAELITPIPDIGFVEKFAHLPLLSHPRPERVLIISGGAGGLIAEILKHGSVELIEYAELDPSFLELIRRYSTPLTEQELNHPKVKVRPIDGRLLLRTTQQRYDVILVGILNPSDLQTNRFFTEEFFALAKKKMNQNGILVIGLPGSLSYLNDELRNLNGSIFRTLKTSFPYVRVFPGEGLNLFLSSSSDEVLRFNQERLIARLKEREIKVNVLVARHIEKILHPRWQDWFLDFIAGGSRKINYDFRPLGVFYSISHWNSIFAPYLCGLFRFIEKLNLWFFIVATVLSLGISFIIGFQKKRSFNSGIPLCIATTGFAGMIFDLAIIFTFQSIYGHIFSWIGLLVTSFMVGVAAGAMAMTALLSRVKVYLRILVNIELAIIGFSLVLPLIFHILRPNLVMPGVSIGVVVLFLAISLISGFLIGAQFPIAAKVFQKDEKNLTDTAGILYSSDLVGGWLGGVVGGVVLLPVLGLMGSCVVVFLLKMFSLIHIIAPLGMGFGMPS